MLWWADADQRLTARAGREIARADVIHISPISCWEIATLVRLERIRLDRDVHVWIRDLLHTERVELAHLSPETAASAGLVPDTFPGDPADRVIYAQARELATTLITKDGNISDHARRTREVRTVW